MMHGTFVHALAPAKSLGTAGYWARPPVEWRMYRYKVLRKTRQYAARWSLLCKESHADCCCCHRLARERVLDGVLVYEYRLLYHTQVPGTAAVFSSSTVRDTFSMLFVFVYYKLIVSCCLMVFNWCLHTYTRYTVYR